MARQTVVLGISIGTRSMGIAILRSGDLVDWEMRSFQGVWSLKKLKTTTVALRRLINDTSPSIIAIHPPDRLAGSKGLPELLHAIEVLALEEMIPFRIYTLTDLKKGCGTKEKINKQNLTAFTLKKYPELFREYAKEERYKRPYYTKIFEAVMAAGLFFK